jgi:potassium voltage-gated channel Eag-related subfamily H protein 8
MAKTIPQPGKDNSEPSNYCHITLASCVCKTMERMINAHLVWFLEPNDLKPILVNSYIN